MAKKEPPRITYDVRDERQPHGPKVGEAVIAYEVDRVGGEIPMSGITRLSAKNQITLPASIVRQLGMRPGDEIDLLALEGKITLERRPRTPEEWADRLAGAMDDVSEWATDEGTDAWIRTERQGWERRPEEV
jgi:AbrB family looped-hinge helix DNA binding protein